MKGLKYQLKNIRRDKLCILTFFLPILVGIGIRLMSGFQFSSAAEISFGVIEGNLTSEAVSWLEKNGTVSSYETLEELRAALEEPSTQMIGVEADAAIRTSRFGDEMEMTAKVADALPQMYAMRQTAASYDKTVVPVPMEDNNFLRSLLVVITLVTALFMGCTFTAMSMIGEKEDGITYIHEVIPVKQTQYMIQKMLLGFLGSVISTSVTAAVCVRMDPGWTVPVLLLVLLASFIAALVGLWIGRFSNGLMIGIVYIKVVMILFIAPPILFYLYTPAGSILRRISYMIPSGAAFYGFMDLLNGRTEELGIYLAVLFIHGVLWFCLYLKRSK